MITWRQSSSQRSAGGDRTDFTKRPFGCTDPPKLIEAEVSRTVLSNLLSHLSSLKWQLTAAHWEPPHWNAWLKYSANRSVSSFTQPSRPFKIARTNYRTHLPPSHTLIFFFFFTTKTYEKNMVSIYSKLSACESKTSAGGNKGKMMLLILCRMKCANPQTPICCSSATNYQGCTRTLFLPFKMMNVRTMFICSLFIRSPYYGTLVPHILNAHVKWRVVFSPCGWARRKLVVGSLHYMYLIFPKS